MEIFPAIDLRGGKAVRLYKGDYDQMTVYADNPAQLAEKFKSEGAENLHIVDLDGAKDGTLANFEAVKSIVQIKGMFTEIGGGIRNEERIEKYLSLGVNRVILGTAAIKNFGFVTDMVKKYGEAIAVGVDASNGFVAVNGWKEITDVPSVEFCEKCRDAGVSTVIYTDISKDGTLTGTNLEIYSRLNQIKGLKIVASGGISFLPEIETLAKSNTYAAIVGKAIYENKLSLAECISAAREGMN